MGYLQPAGAAPIGITRTAEAYKAAVNQFRLGAINAEALAKVIERTIVPDLQKVG